jgi:SPP1 family predicted phage head-tail adaptor
MLSTDAYGERIETFVDVCSVWAERIDIKAADRLAAAGTDAYVDTRWRIRYRRDVRVGMRLVYKGEIHKIKKVTEIGRLDGNEIQTECRGEHVNK